MRIFYQFVKYSQLLVTNRHIPPPRLFALVVFLCRSWEDLGVCEQTTFSALAVSRGRCAMKKIILSCAVSVTLVQPPVQFVADGFHEVFAIELNEFGDEFVFSDAQLYICCHSRTPAVQGAEIIF